MIDPILILRLSALGDVIHTLPAVVAIRAANPDAPIGWVIEKPYAELVELTAPADRIFVVSTKQWRGSLGAKATRRDVARSISAMRRFARGGRAIDFQGLMKSALFARLSGAKERIGFDRESIREPAAGLFLNRRRPVDRSGHVIEWNMQLAAALGADPARVPEVDLSRWIDDPEGTMKPLAADRPIVLLAGAGKREKWWGAERFAALARDVAGSRRVVVAWGPGEREEAENIAAAGRAELAPPSSLRELSYLLAHAAVVVGGDTGPLHIAAALGTPVVGLYGPTDPRRNGPWGQLDRVVVSRASGGAMSGVPVGDVVTKVETILRS